MRAWRGAVILSCALALALGAAARPKEAAVKDADAELHARYPAPKGWRQKRSSDGPDRTARFTSSRRVLKVALLGGKDSRYPTPQDFLAGPSATTMGRPPEPDGEATVAGAKVPVYKHGFPVELGDPHAVSPGEPKLATERFAIVPGKGGRYWVLSYAWESPVPEAGEDGRKAWESLLSGFQPLK